MIKTTYKSLNINNFLLTSYHFLPITYFPLPTTDHVSVIPDRVSVVTDHVSIITDRVRVVTDHVSIVSDRVSIVTDHVSIVTDRVSIVTDHVSIVYTYCLYRFKPLITNH
jgi:hypothetical protein